MVHCTFYVLCVLPFLWYVTALLCVLLPKKNEPFSENTGFKYIRYTLYTTRYASLYELNYSCNLQETPGVTTEYTGYKAWNYTRVIRTTYNSAVVQLCTL